MKKALSIIVLAAAVASMTGCSSNSENGESAVTAAATSAAGETTIITTTAVTATTAAEAPAADETATSETTKASPAQTTAAGDFDLDAMIASAEAMIPDITTFTGLKDINVTVTSFKNDSTKESNTIITNSSAAKDETTTMTSAVAKEKTTTATTIAPSTVSAPVTDMFSFNFDGVTYKMPVSGSQLQLPNGWVEDTLSGRSNRIFNKSGFDGCHIEELHRGGDKLNGVYVHVVNDLQDGKPVPVLSMAGGISWGATKEQVKDAFGAPARESAYNNYNTTTTALFYSSNEGDTMVLYIPENCGLALIELYRN